jgi:hypothetical protein
MRLTLEGTAYRLECTPDEATRIYAHINLALERVLERDFETITGFSREFAIDLSRAFNLMPDPESSGPIGDLTAQPTPRLLIIEIGPEKLIALNNLLLASTMTRQAQWPWVRMEGGQTLPSALRRLLSEIDEVLPST